MVVHNRLELGFTFPSTPRLEKLITTLTRAEHQERYCLSARLAHRLAQQLVRLGDYQAALHWLERSLQLYKLQTELTLDFWETLHDWFSVVLIVKKDGELQDVLECLRSQLQPLGSRGPELGSAFLANAFTEKTLSLETPQLELRFFGKAWCRIDDTLPTLRPRFAELLAVLALHPEGLTNEQLTLAVYGETTDIACCKTELSRLKHLIPVISRPYRLEGPVWADFLELPKLLKAGRIGEAINLYEGPLLPSSEAPEICSLRRSLEQSLCTVTIESGTCEDLWKLGSRIHDDLELWEAIQARLSQGDPRRGMAKAHVTSLRRSWGIH